MIKVEVQGVNVLDVYNQLKAVLNQFKSFVDSDRAMDDKAPGMVDAVVSTVAAPSEFVSNLAPQDANQVVPTTTVTMQPNSVSMTVPNAAVQVTPTQVALQHQLSTWQLMPRYKLLPHLCKHLLLLRYLKKLRSIHCLKFKRLLRHYLMPVKL